MNFIKSTQVLFLYLLLSNVCADTENPRFKAVQQYLLEGNDYPELFEDRPYRLKIEGLAIGDLDSDGVDEVVLQFKPHYLQSPTIVIFRVDDKMNVTRVIEGLAPGPVKAISGDYLDSHTMGLGVDIEIKAEDAGKQDDIRLVSEMLRQFGGVVEYPGWYHLDNRTGKGMYLDMRHANIPDNKHNCENFEFSTVQQIQIASRNGEKGNHLLVYADNKLYAYRIHQFLDNGLIKKELTIHE